MPIYTYRCENCGVQFEKTQSFDDKPLTRCPECSKNTLRKVYLPVGIVFKGSGFYATDHRSASGQNRSSNGHSNKPADSDSKSDSESKPSASDKPSPSSLTDE